MERLFAMPLLSMSLPCCSCVLRRFSQNASRIVKSKTVYYGQHPGYSSPLLVDSNLLNHNNFSQICRNRCLSSFISRSQATTFSSKNVTKYQMSSMGKSWNSNSFVCHMSSNSKKVPPKSARFPFWQRLLFVSGVGSVMFYLFKDALHEKEIESEQTRYQELGKAQLGGDWTLTDHHGNRRSASEFHGRWVLLYFGFTHCPDICPEELEKLIQIVNRFEKDPSQPNVQPLFISVDPERDSPKAIKDYCAEYSPHLIGFTGSEEELREVCKKFRVYYGKGERDENNDYIVDHTIIIYLLNPKGEFVNYFGRNLTADNVYTAVLQHINRYRELEQKGKLDAKKNPTT